MSGTEEFGNGGYGTGEFDRAEAGPGAAARGVPSAGARPAGAAHQGPVARDAAGGGGAPWLAGGAVPYAEAVFGQGAGPGQQDAVGPQGQPGAVRGQRGTAGPGRRAQQPQGQGDGGFAGDGYGEGYVNGYGSRPAGVAQVPQVPQQRFDAAPFDSGFTQQGRRFDPREQSRAGGYEAAEPGQPGPAGFDRGGFDPAASGAQFEQQGFESGVYQAPVPVPPGFDAPTTEFRPGPMFDEPTVRPGAPGAGPVAAGAAGGGVNGRGVAFGVRQAPVNGAAQPPSLRPSMSGPGTWTAAPPVQAGGGGAPDAAPEVAGQDGPLPGVVPPGTGQVPVAHPQSSAAAPPVSPPSVSGIPRVPSPSAPGPRPALPDEPLPGPPPLPTRPPRAERQAQQAAAQAQTQARAQRQEQAADQDSVAGGRPGAVQRETLTPPRRGAAAPQQAEAAAPYEDAPQQTAAQAAAAPAAPAAPAGPAAQSAQPAQAARNNPAQGPVQAQAQAPIHSGTQGQVPAGAQAREHGDDLSSERLRSVAPVPPPRVAAGENPAAAAPPRPGPAAGSFGALSQQDPGQDDAGQDDADEMAEEMIVPWQAAPAEADEAQGAPQGVRGGTGQVPVAQPQQPGINRQPAPAPAAVAQAQGEPDRVVPDRDGSRQGVTGQAAAVQGVHSTAPSRAEASAPRARTTAPSQTPAAAPAPAGVRAPVSPGQVAPVTGSAAEAAVQQAQQPAAPAAAPAAPAAAPPVPVAADLPAPRGTRRRVAQPAAAAPAVPAPAAAAPRPAGDPQPAPETAQAPQPPSTPQPQPSAVRGQQPDAPLPAPAGDDTAASAGHEGDGEGHRAPAYDDEALAAVYRVIHERRDVRNDFLPDEVPTEILTRVLEAAHTAPSVGFSQPWDFLVIRDEAMRRAVHDLAVRQRRVYAASLPKARARAFAALKIEAILETPVNIVVTCDPTRGGRHTLGRYTQPMMAPFSSCLAVENLWLAARAEGLGVGWVSFFDERELSAVLDLPSHLQVVAYLCVGYVKSFPPEPELAGAGWAKRRPLAWAVHEERFGRRALPGEAPISLLSETVDAIRGLDPQALAAARDRQSRMTKPPGSLGVLEAVSEQLAGLAGVCPPPLPEPAALAVFAADHGVHAQGVTPWPQEVTAQMVANFLAGGAVVNAFAKQVGAEVCVVDVGVNAELAAQTGLIPRKVRYGTADMTQGPALTREEAVAALEAGIETARDLVAAGNRCLLTGDMGIANTTASAALIAAFTGASPAQVTGYGTGIDEQTYAHKVDVVRSALQLHRPDPQDPVGVLAAFGGLEHAALAGFILGAAALRVPVVLDGVIAGAAALVAQALSPEVTVACVAGHRSAEPGHALALEALGITPLIDLELRLGEGSGAALALPLVGAAVRALREVATFDDAGVADASEASVLPPTERDRA